MTISILTDNFPGENLPAEHGLSYLIEYDGKKILFDTGQSNLFPEAFIRSRSKPGIFSRFNAIVVKGRKHA